MKKVLLLFTGGLDSTFLLQKNIEEGNSVTCLYNKIKNNGVKTDYEYDSAIKIFNKYRDKNPKACISFVENETSLKGNYPPNPQIYMNLSNIIFYGLIGCYDEIQIGYVTGDFAISYLNEITKIFNFCKRNLNFSGSKTKLVFPLKKMNKYEIITKIPRNILELISSCENITDDGKHLTPCIIDIDGGFSFKKICDKCLDNLAIGRYYHQGILLLNNTKKKSDLIYI